MNVKCLNCGNNWNNDFSGRCTQCASAQYTTLEQSKSLPRIPDFIETLDRMKELHLKKNADYAVDDNPFSNFEFTEFVLKHFKSDRDKSYVWPIATKLTRLATLLSSDKPPNNESIEDSFDDIAVYTILWKCDVKRRNNAK